jgi:CRISPR-associated protein Cas2
LEVTAVMVLVSYDVAVSNPGGARRLRRVAKACTNFGQRVQLSVFECDIDPAQWVKLKSTLEGIIDTKTDSLRYYYMGANWKRKVEHVGAKPTLDLDEPLII